MNRARMLDTVKPIALSCGIVFFAVCVSAPAAEAPKSKFTDYAYGIGKGHLDSETGGHWFNCGPTGIRASIPFERRTEFLVKYVFAHSPAYQKVLKEDRIVGANGKKWTEPDQMTFGGMKSVGIYGPRNSLGKAIEETEGSTGSRRGKLTLIIIRDGRTMEVDIALKPIGRFSATFPRNCAKTRILIKDACDFLAKHQQPSQGRYRGHWDSTIPPILALLSQGKEYMPQIQKYIQHNYAAWEGVGGKYSGSWTWCNAMRGMLHAELYLATGDKRLLPAMEGLDKWYALTQDNDGGYHHHPPPGMEWAKSDGGYGAMAFPTAMTCTAWALFKRCGIKINEEQYDKSRRLLDFSTNPYGEIGYGMKKGQVSPDPVPILKGSARSGKPIRMWGATGFATMMHYLDPYESYSDYYVQRGIEAIAHAKERFPDGHGSSMLHQFSGFLTAGLIPAVGNEKAYRKFADWHIPWLNINRTHDGSFYTTPNRDANGDAGRDLRFSITGSVVLFLSSPKRNLEMLGRNPFVPGIDPQQLTGNARSAYIAMSKGDFAGVMKKIKTLEAGEKQDQRVAELLGKYISERMQQALGDLAGFEKERKLLQLTTCLEESNKMFVGIPAYDEKTAMLTSLLLKGKGGTAIGFIERDKYASALKMIATMKQESEDAQRVFRLMSNHVSGRMQQALDDLAGFEKEQKLLELTTCLEESNKMFTGIPAYDEKTAMLTSLLLKGRGRIALGFIARDKYGSAMKAAAPMKEKGEDAQRVFLLLQNHAITYVTGRITEIEAQHKVGDLYKVSLLIAVADKTCKGVAKYDQTLAPIKLIMKSLESRKLISRGREYYRILGIYNRTKNKADRKRITVFAERYADTFYGKLAAALP